MERADVASNITFNTWSGLVGDVPCKLGDIPV